MPRDGLRTGNAFRLWFMNVKGILAGLLTGAIFIPAIAVIAVLALADDSGSNQVTTSAVLAAGATLTSIWALSRLRALLAQARVRDETAATAWLGILGAVLLAGGFASVAFYAWEEVVVGYETPTINLLIFLIPAGLLITAVALVVAVVEQRNRIPAP